LLPSSRVFSAFFMLFLGKFLQNRQNPLTFANAGMRVAGPVCCHGNPVAVKIAAVFTIGYSLRRKKLQKTDMRLTNLSTESGGIEGLLNM